MGWKDVAAAATALTGGAVTMNTVFGAPWEEVLPFVKAGKAYNDPNTQGLEKLKNVGKELAKDAIIFGAAAVLGSMAGAGVVAFGAGLLARPALRLLGPPLIEAVGSRIAGSVLSTVGRVIGAATGVTIGIGADVVATTAAEPVATLTGNVIDKVAEKTFSYVPISEQAAAVQPANAVNSAPEKSTSKVTSESKIVAAQPQAKINSTP